MQVGFSPLNIKSPSMPQPQKQKVNNNTLQTDTFCLSSKNKNINFSSRINVKHSINKPDTLQDMFYMNAHEDSDENRKLLKQVVAGIKKRYGEDAKWDIKEIKEAIFEKTNWKQDDELKEILK